GDGDFDGRTSAGEAQPRVAVFRPDDERLTEAIDLLETLGADPLPDPMLAVEPTGATPRTDAEYTIFTSKTGAEIVEDAGWQAPAATRLCAIGETTATALEMAGYGVAEVPEEFSSRGLVDHLGDAVEGRRVEVARSDHGSEVLIEGLEALGAYVHETVLYRLVRPPEAGDSVTATADGDVDAVLFTSSLTVEHFLDVARDRGQEETVRSGLEDAVVGAIGAPTRETAVALGIDVDVVPETADFEALAEAVLDEFAGAVEIN
ncbi:MAG: uroporphyrinogen-III synthase, partial [Haloarculaceae archaeon]